MLRKLLSVYLSEMSSVLKFVVLLGKIRSFQGAGSSMPPVPPALGQWVLSQLQDNLSVEQFIIHGPRMREIKEN